MNETSKESTSWGSWFTGLMLGTVAGLAVAILYAPRPGKETREEILVRLDELRDRVDETTRQLSEVAKTRLEETCTDLSQAIQATRDAVTERTAELRRKAGME